MGQTSKYPRLEFHDGYLHVIHQPKFRVRAEPRVCVETSADGRTWSLLDAAQRDRVYDAIGCLRFPGPSGIVFQDSHWWQGEGGQGCFDWGPTNEDRELAWSTYCWRELETSVADRMAGLPEPLVDWFSAVALLQEAPESADLLTHDPLLFVALARHWEFPGVRKEDWDGVRTCMRRKRRHIIEWLGYPASEASVNGLRRHHIAEIFATEMGRHVRSFLKTAADPSFGSDILRLEQTDDDLISALADPVTATWLTPELLRDILRATRKWEKRAADEIEEVTAMVKCGLVQPTPDFIRQHRQRVRANARICVSDIADLPFPRWLAPIADSVQPLTSVHQLVEESEDMDHCVGCVYYITRALMGEVALFRVTAPVRATLALWHHHGTWGLEDLRGFQNAEITEEAQREIERAFPCRVRWPRHSA